MISLSADNRFLTEGARFAFLTDNYSAGVSTINVTVVTGFNVDDFILIGDFGQETAEIFRIASVNASTGDIVLHDKNGNGASLLYGHAESSKVYQLEYNQIRFYWTASSGTISDENPVFDTSNPLTGYVDIDPSALYSTYADVTHSSGFGWFTYFNSTTLTISTNSNPIPYGGFDANTTASVFADFESMLNVSQFKLVSRADEFSWLNEGLSLLKNKLNLTNVEYTVGLPVTLSVVAGTQEYQLPSDFSDMISVSFSSNAFSPVSIPFLPVYKIDSYPSLNTTVYYLRNRYIGFAPLPTSSFTVQYRYRARAVRVTSLSDYIDLPDNAWYALKDWMLYRAMQKFSNPSAAAQYLQSFTNSVNMYMQSSVKRDSNLDSITIDRCANS